MYPKKSTEKIDVLERVLKNKNEKCNKMKLARVEVESDGVFKYEASFNTMGHKDEKILFKSVMENLLFIGETIESSKCDVSNFKQVILDFANAYLIEGKNDYFNYDRELYYDANNNEIHFNLDWGNWPIDVEIDVIDFEVIKDGFIINMKE